MWRPEELNHHHHGLRGLFSLYIAGFHIRQGFEQDQMAPHLDFSRSLTSHVSPGYGAAGLQSPRREKRLPQHLPVDEIDAILRWATATRH